MVLEPEDPSAAPEFSSSIDQLHDQALYLKDQIYRISPLASSNYPWGVNGRVGGNCKIMKCN